MVHPLSRITLFWGHCKALDFPLEDDLQLFPGLQKSSLKFKTNFSLTMNATMKRIMIRNYWQQCYWFVWKYIWFKIQKFGFRYFEIDRTVRYSNKKQDDQGNIKFIWKICLTINISKESTEVKSYLDLLPNEVMLKIINFSKYKEVRALSK